ncbi:MAG TPA: maleylpyruvate isomerase family mycothiol-dependent enzyme [Acidimicrobiales bacterium]|nr:maleylpyruvate isomerase family mycothiol-dependent enzyme [Acidimicrobiales bacterium]
MDYLEAIVDNSAVISAFAEQIDLGTQIPSCPGWTAGDLIFHLASVHRFWAAAVRERNPGARPNLVGCDVDDAELLAWAREQVVSLVDALAAAGGAPCWTWWGEPRAADAVARHQVQESVVHCWDIGHALGRDFEIPTNQALDGIAEFVELQSTSLEKPVGHHLSFRPTDGADVVTYGDLSLPRIALYGAASDIVLVMYKRRPLESLRVDGDVAVTQQWLDCIDLS